MFLVDLARFERATSTFAESRSHSPELQVRDIFDFRLPIADLVWLICRCRVLISDFWIKCPARPIGSWQSQIDNDLAEAAGVEPAHAMRGDLANRCHTC